MARLIAERSARVRERIGSRFKASDIVRGSLTIAAGTGAAQLIVIAASPVLTRLFSPTEFGAYSAVLAVLAILSVFACLAYDRAVPLPLTDEEAANILMLCLIITLAVSGALALILIPLGPIVLDAVGAPSLRGYGWFLVLGVLGDGLASALLGWAVRMKAYGDIATNRVLERSSMVIAQLGLGFAGWGAVGLLVGAILSSFVSFARLATIAWRGHRAALERITSAGVRAAARRYRRFPLLSAPAHLINVLGLQAPLLLMVALFGAAVGGQFALAHRVLALPISLIAQSLSQTFTGEAAHVAREDRRLIAPLYVRTTRALAMWTIGPAVLAAIAAPFLFGLVFGPEWSEAGVFAALLTPMYWMQLLTTPTHGALTVLERQDLHLTRETARLLLFGGAVAVAWLLGLSPVGAVAVISVAGMLTYALYGFTTWRAISSAVGRTDVVVPEPVTIDPADV
jgi:O-antigen/teichoic acid export membrane protein